MACLGTVGSGQLRHGEVCSDWAWQVRAVEAGRVLAWYGAPYGLARLGEVGRVMAVKVGFGPERSGVDGLVGSGPVVHGLARCVRFGKSWRLRRVEARRGTLRRVAFGCWRLGFGWARIGPVGLGRPDRAWCGSTGSGWVR